ncbi:hypothetical protein [Rhizobium lusitanum]|uniref:Uncharacterized protein n=1 Tax=Rhizobium lusitanum TaxID=293958 RepID=A0A1C3VT86_9HYPH|nr:hypothetical protein [Rhizobium lusitanum]SCB30787.1 hypothetical protein GA0061101_106159 [Rhizobium lusitanum]
MTKSKAAATIVMWISIGVTLSVSVVSCQRYHSAVEVAKIESETAQWNSLHEDCRERKGLFVRSWGDWECEVGR